MDIRMSSRKLGWAAAVVLLGAAAGEFWHMQAEVRRDRDQIAHLEASVARLSDRPAVRVEHETLVERMMGHDVRPAAAADSPGGATPPKDSRPIEQVVGEFLSTHYADEPIDHDWSTRTFNGLKDAVASLGVDRNVESIDCRSALCRIQSRFSDMPTYNRFMDQLAAQPDGDGMISPSYQEGPDGVIVATSYWVRAGQMSTVTGGLARGPHEKPPRA